MNPREDAEKVVRLLKSIGISAKYHHYDFESEREIDYATFEITSPERFSSGLEEEINSKSSMEGGGTAEIRFIGIQELGRGLFRYIAEIVPYRTFHKQQLAEATNRFLHSLPKVVGNYIKMKLGKKTQEQKSREQSRWRNAEQINSHHSSSEFSEK